MSFVEPAVERTIGWIEKLAGPATLPPRQRLYAAFSFCFGVAFLVSLPFNSVLGYPMQQQLLAVGTVLLMLLTYLSQRFDRFASVTAIVSPYASLALVAAFTVVTGGMGGSMSHALSFLVVYLIVMPVGRRLTFALALVLTVVVLTVLEAGHPELVVSPYRSAAERLADIAFTIVMAVAGTAVALLYLDSLVRVRTGQLEAANRALTEQSLTDPLTGLHNRRYLERALSEDLALLRRELRGRPPDRQGWALLVVDLDNFKRVNDLHGHLAGDEVLKYAAQLICTTVRASDIVVRWGGEEFLVVARALDARGAAQLAERLRTAFERATAAIPDGPALRVTCSIGAAPYPLFAGALEAISWDAHLSLADHAMYEAKRSGRNAACCVAARPPEGVTGPWPSTAPEMIAAGLVEVIPAATAAAS